MVRAVPGSPALHNSDLVVGWHEQTPKWNEATIEWWAQNVWHPDIEWRAIQGAPDDVGWMKGRDRLRAYYAEWLELFDDIRHEVLDRYDVGDVVVLGFRVTARSRSSDMPLELVYAVVHELRDGKLVRGREYLSVDEALQAVDGSEAPA